MDSCNYCANIFGRAHGADTVPAFDAIIEDLRDFVLAPTLGMFIPGHFLIISKEHRPAFSFFSRRYLHDLDVAVNYLSLRYSKTFGNYFFFEHGVGSDKEKLKKQCVNHAHLHMIPYSKVVDVVIHRLDMHPLSSLSDIKILKNKDYALIRDNAGNWFGTSSPGLESQWIRKVVAGALKISHWDWSQYPGFNELETTFKELNIENDD